MFPDGERFSVKPLRGLLRRAPARGTPARAPRRLTITGAARDSAQGGSKKKRAAPPQGGTAKDIRLVLHLDGKVLLRHLLLGGGEESLAEHVGVHVDQDLVPGADAGSNVEIVGAVPLGTRGVLGQSFEYVVEAGLLGLAFDHVLGELAQAGGEGIAIGEGPGAELAGAALGDHGRFNTLEDGGEVARFLGEVESESPGITHQGAGEVGFDEKSAIGEELLEQGLGVGVVGAEESGFLAVLLDPLGDLLEDELLSAGHADVGGRVRGGFEGELDAQVVAGFFHDGPAASERLVAHVPGEGNVDEGLGAQLLGCPDDGVAAGNEVGGKSQIGGALDYQGVLMGLAGEEKDVLVLLADALEGLGGSGNGLVDDDSFHKGIVGQSDHGGDEGLLLGHEIIGIGDVLDHAPGFYAAVSFDEGFGTPQVIFGLGYCTGYHTDVELGLGLGEHIRPGKNEGQRQ
ncbi:hypothetical protein SDC9_05293 [bioreactor metagenome]|uniref:Uncharacterized protein n=1 Tax=bioreactor metagenome TaxID=1076179 RepID=A0A644SYG8_9ZZZZ